MKCQTPFPLGRAGERASGLEVKQHRRETFKGRDSQAKGKQSHCFISWSLSHGWRSCPLQPPTCKTCFPFPSILPPREGGDQVLPVASSHTSATQIHIVLGSANMRSWERGMTVARRTQMRHKMKWTMQLEPCGYPKRRVLRGGRSQAVTGKLASFEMEDLSFNDLLPLPPHPSLPQGPWITIIRRGADADGGRFHTA